tara:strand:+ start:4045 stop:4209 length:165 start_codon:yes stop_codon:yes gene_type:complete
MKTFDFSVEFVPFIGFGVGTQKIYQGRRHTFFIPFAIFHIEISKAENKDNNYTQ